MTGVLILFAGISQEHCKVDHIHYSPIAVELCRRPQICVNYTAYMFKKVPKMKNRYCLILVFSLFIMLSVPVFAEGGGGGGMYLGYQITRYPFLDNYEIASNTLGLAYYGGFGYGVSEKRAIIGGFGAAIMDISGGSEIAGGFGGFISGFRIFHKPINLSIVSWTGFGGISTGIQRIDDSRGFFALFEEIVLEVGLPILRWFMPTIYIGYQVAGNLIPGFPFNSFFSYTPVAGFRIQWGKFY